VTLGAVAAFCLLAGGCRAPDEEGRRINLRRRDVTWPTYDGRRIDPGPTPPLPREDEEATDEALRY
jgi:hypothetical protein